MLVVEVELLAEVVSLTVEVGLAGELALAEVVSLTVEVVQAATKNHTPKLVASLALSL